MMYHFSGSMFFFLSLAWGSACETKKEKKCFWNKNSFSEKRRLRMNKKASCTFPDKLCMNTKFRAAVFFSNVRDNRMSAFTGRFHNFFCDPDAMVLVHLKLIFGL